MLLLDRLQELQAVEPAALQPDVEKHEIGAPGCDLGQRIVALARGARDIALVLQDPGNQLPDVGLVVDDQNIECHSSFSRLNVRSMSRRGYFSLVLDGNWRGRKSQPHPGASLARNALGSVVQLDLAAVLLED